MLKTKLLNKFKIVKKTILFVIWFFLLNPISCNSSIKENVKITSVHDGDTFSNSSGVIYRLFGVDTPEISDQYKNFVPTEGIEHFYAQMATDATKSLIENKKVIVENKSMDVYARHVAKVKTTNNIDLGEYLIRKGLARVAYFDVVNTKSPYYSTDYTYYNLLVWAQHQAFEAHIGIWRDLNEFKTIFPKA